MAATDFTGTLDAAVVSGTIDLAVHSLKDLPPLHRWNRPSLTIGLHMPRENPHDVLIGMPGITSLTAIPTASRVGSSSV
eukprot:CAMPEP_0183376512 /NCGR_PEP_ID=MMETSP0164_2-20130417/120510_1 /TAXON_ID=221442 /ORGANISM="Coccolithus pelagicus ssp braarudi, Strain PLY182g" /LENGTH=78 /DNA_ID=CAMNT_0025553827 /DNA_START=105 /DNA_END=338 /DNA_ORIENTATION=-